MIMQQETRVCHQEYIKLDVTKIYKTLKKSEIVLFKQC